MTNWLQVRDSRSKRQLFWRMVRYMMFSIFMLSNVSLPTDSSPYDFILVGSKLPYCGSLSLAALSCSLTLSWHASREVSVRPNAMSSISYSRSSGSGSCRKTSSFSIMMWQVEHAQVPPQAPATGVLIYRSNSREKGMSDGMIRRRIRRSEGC